MDDEVFKTLWGGVMTVGAGALTFITTRATKAHDSLRDDVDELREDLNDHQLHTSETYAKDTTMQQSLGRLHERIDQASSELRGAVDTVAADIKTLLTRVK